MPWLLRMTLLVSALMLPAVIYLIWRLLSAIRTNSKLKSNLWQIAVIGLLFSFYLLPLSGFLDWFVTGDIDLLKYPPPVTYWFWFGLVFCYQIATWVLVADLIKLISRFTSWHDLVSSYHRQIVLLLFPIIFIYVGSKMYVDTTHIVTEQQTLHVENLPDSLHEFRIIHISDIQGDEYTGREKIAAYINEVNKKEGNLVIFTGDLISYGTDFIEMSAREFGRVESTHGALAVVGDHDYWAGIEYVRPALEKQNISLLQDENRVIEIDSTSSLLVTGITEVYSQRSDPEEAEQLMQDADSHSVKILASHQVAPYLVKKAGDYGYNLLLAGHTHGGQVRVPFLGMTFSASENETEYVSGAHWVNGLLINVNNGLGFTLAPVRYNARPAITIIELLPETD